MATPEIHVRVTHVSALAVCGVCATLVSWKLPWQKLDRVGELRCPQCGGGCDAVPNTCVMLIERSGETEVAS